MSTFSRSRRRSSGLWSIMGLPIGLTVAVWGLALWAWCAMTLHIVYWLAGVWIPWFVAIFGIIGGPVTVCGWLILWALHYIPSVHFPLIHG